MKLEILVNRGSRRFLAPGATLDAKSGCKVTFAMSEHYFRGMKVWIVQSAATLDSIERRNKVAGASEGKGRKKSESPGLALPTFYLALLVDNHLMKRFFAFALVIHIDAGLSFNNIDSSYDS